MQNHLPNKINQTKIISLHRHLRRSAGKRAKKATTEIHQYRFIHICLIHLYTQATSVIPSENQTWFSSEISQLAMYDCWLVTSHMIPYYPPLFHSLRWISDFRLKRCSLPWDLFLDFTHDLPFLRNFHGFPQVLPMISPQKKTLPRRLQYRRRTASLSSHRQSLADGPIDHWMVTFIDFP